MAFPVHLTTLSKVMELQMDTAGGYGRPSERRKTSNGGRSIVNQNTCYAARPLSWYIMNSR